MRSRPSASRPGLSLLEVIVALAVFLMSLVGLGHLVNVASNNALAAHDRSQAARLCRSKLAEVLAGSVPLSSQSGTPFDEDPDFQWSLDAEQNSTQGLYNVTVRVTRKNQGGQDLECSLSQMVLDPSMLGSTQDSVPPQMSATAASGSSSSSSGSSSSPSSSGSTGSSGGAMGGGAMGGGAMGGGAMGGGAMGGGAMGGAGGGKGGASGGGAGGKGPGKGG